MGIEQSAQTRRRVRQQYSSKCVICQTPTNTAQTAPLLLAHPKDLNREYKSYNLIAQATFRAPPVQDQRKAVLKGRTVSSREVVKEKHLQEEYPVVLNIVNRKHEPTSGSSRGLLHRHSSQRDLCKPSQKSRGFTLHLKRCPSPDNDAQTAASADVFTRRAYPQQKKMVITPFGVSLISSCNGGVFKTYCAKRSSRQCTVGKSTAATPKTDYTTRKSEEGFY